MKRESIMKVKKRGQIMQVRIGTREYVVKEELNMEWFPNVKQLLKRFLTIENTRGIRFKLAQQLDGKWIMTNDDFAFKGVPVKPVFI